MQPLYKLMEINSERLVIDRNVYQRKQHNDKITQIVASWDERIANEPKISLRDGVYHVFDGQHTILAREAMNDNNPVKILCKVYYGLSERRKHCSLPSKPGFRQSQVQVNDYEPTCTARMRKQKRFAAQQKKPDFRLM